MLSLNERLTLRDLIEQGWKQVQQEVLEQLRRTIEGLLQAERDRRVTEAQQRGEKVYRWGYTVRKCWTTLWGTLHQIRVPRLRGAAEIGLLEKYQRHDLGQVLFALTVGGLSQRKVVDWMRRFAGGTLSVATIHAVLARAQQDIVARRTAPLSPAEFPILVVDALHHRYRRRAQRGPRAGVLLVAVGVGSYESYILVNTVTPLIGDMGLTQRFVGLVLIALLTNISEHISAISFARKNNMTMSLEIGMSSALQIALFVVPVLVLLSTALTGNAMDLVFGPFSLVALVMTAMIANYLSSDGICHWLEGVQLISVYLLIAIAFYFI